MRTLVVPLERVADQLALQLAYSVCCRLRTSSSRSVKITSQTATSEKFWLRKSIRVSDCARNLNSENKSPLKHENVIPQMHYNLTTSIYSGYTMFHANIMSSVNLPQPPSFDDKLAALDSVPLFMRSLPEDGTDDVTLSALQSLVHDGTPDGG